MAYMDQMQSTVSYLATAGEAGRRSLDGMMGPVNGAISEITGAANELEDLQQAVGGDIEMTYPFDDEVGILLNGNGKFEGLPLNRALYDDHGQVYDAIAGTFLVVGLTEDDFTSLTPGQIEKFKEKYQSPEIFTLFNGELHVMKMPPEEAKKQKESRKNDEKQKNPAKKKNRSGDAR